MTNDLGNRLYLEIVRRLEPYVPKDSRDLEWDVLPSTLAAMAKELAELRAKSGVSKPLTYKDVVSSLLEPPLPRVPRSEISTLSTFYLPHAAVAGVVTWGGRLYYARQFMHETSCPLRYWLIKLTVDEEIYARAYVSTYASFFSNAMLCRPDGTRPPLAYGAYARTDEEGTTFMTHEGWTKFDSLFPHGVEPSEGALVVGWFSGWVQSP